MAEAEGQLSFKGTNCSKDKDQQASSGGSPGPTMGLRLKGFVLTARKETSLR